MTYKVVDFIRALAVEILDNLSSLAFPGRAKGRLVCDVDKLALRCRARVVDEEAA